MIAEAARGSSRNHIAQSEAEIYPARPDLARAVEFSPGWLIGLNIANREKMSYARKLVTVISGGVFDLLDPVLERHSFDDLGKAA